MTSNDYTLKTCHDCKAEKSLVEFHKDKDKKDGVRYRCKLCDKKYGSYYYRTKAGVASSIYGAQKDSSKRRGHPLPNYTKADFSKWLFSNKNFHILFDKWVTSGYLKNEKPSCDRLNDYLPYTLDNLQVITWKENSEKAYSDIKNGINNKQSKAIIQSSLDGDFIKEHYSAMQAARETGIDRSHISRCCRGELNKTGGFKWEFARKFN